jgi:uncharacterized protein involved in oxidation of intracellular sulfur
LLILNDPPYGTERAFNGLRLANAVAKRDDTEVRVFLMGDAVDAAEVEQRAADGQAEAVAGVGEEREQHQRRAG